MLWSTWHKRSDNQCRSLRKPVTCEQRIRKTESEKKAQEKEERRQIEIEKLTSIQIIDTVEDLHKEITKIDQDKSSTIPGKEKKKLELLKNQVRIRNKVMGKSTKITFSVGGTQKTSDILLER